MTEIKPIGFDRSDPDALVRRATMETLKGLWIVLRDQSFVGYRKTSAAHLRWMVVECMERIRTMPIDKLGRWVGFIQGVMAANGALDVDEERDRTRPLFEEAYAARLTPPPQPAYTETP